MVTEAIIIIILIAVISGVFLREKRYDYAKSTGVLLIMPLAYLFGFALSRPIATLKQVERIDVILVAIIIGLMISCILLGLRCISIKQKKAKTRLPDCKWCVYWNYLPYFYLRYPYPIGEIKPLGI